MKTEEFAIQLQEALQQRGYQNIKSRATEAPGVSMECSFDGVPVQFDLDVGGKAILRVPVPQPFQLSLSPESTVTRILDEVGQSREVKTGFAQFDENYLVQLHPPTFPLFTSDSLQAIAGLEPFIELTGGRSGLEVSKTWEVGSFGPEDAARSVDSLLVLFHLAQLAARS
jgi:hypothetical protein